MSDIEKRAEEIDPEAWTRWRKERGGIGLAWFLTEGERQAAFAQADTIIAPSLAAAHTLNLPPPRLPRDNPDAGQPYLCEGEDLSDHDEFGDRMKAYEGVETSRRFDMSLPIYARIDGRSFSRFTRGMQRPFDARMTEAMIETARHLVDATHARIGYTQSDEISLVWLGESEESQTFFAGKVMKLTSVLASLSAAKFARVCPEGFEDRLPHFDARVFQLPNKIEGANAFLWRALDARKNAVSMVAQAHFSPRQLHGKGQADMLAMLAEIGIDFESFPASFKRGTFLRRETLERELTPEELERIPEKHRPTGPVLRHQVAVLDMPPFNLVANRVGVVFDDESPSASDPRP